MGHYVDKGSQTLIEGLSRDPVARPVALFPIADTTTPPDDMVLDKLNLSLDAAHMASSKTLDLRPSPALLLRRKNRPPLMARISMPASEYSTEAPASPPPTETILSPLPAINKLHAGHTPIIPCARSPLPQDKSDPPTPEPEEYLTGPLTLPPQPSDGADDTISLSVLDAELEKIRIQRERAEQVTPSPTETPISPQLYVVDGVILKKPKMNLGAPLGQV